MNKKLWIIVVAEIVIISGLVFGSLINKKQNNPNNTVNEIVDTQPEKNNEINENVNDEINESINKALDQNTKPEERKQIYNKLSEQKDKVEDQNLLKQIEEYIELDKQKNEEFIYEVRPKIPGRAGDVGIWSNQLQSKDDITYFSINDIELPLNQLQYINNGLNRVYIHYQNEDAPMYEGVNRYEFIYKGQSYSGTFEFEIKEIAMEREICYLALSNEKQWYHPIKTVTCTGECEINCEPTEEYGREIIAWSYNGTNYQIGEIINVQTDMDFYAVYED